MDQFVVVAVESLADSNERDDQTNVTFLKELLESLVFREKLVDLIDQILSVHGEQKVLQEEVADRVKVQLVELTEDEWIDRGIASLGGKLEKHFEDERRMLVEHVFDGQLGEVLGEEPLD